MLNAYLDASDRAGGSTFVVAGLALRKSQLRRFQSEWLEVFGEHGGCHMRELVHGKGRFESLSQESLTGLLRHASAIIRTWSVFGVAISCDRNEVASLLPKNVVGLEHAYPICCRQAMHGLGMQVNQSKYAGNIAYFFESGDRYFRATQKFIRNMVDADAWDTFKSACRYHSHTFVAKKGVFPLEAADVFAWEYAKYIDETVIKRERLMRRSLVEIIRTDKYAYDNRKFKVAHLTGEPLKKYIRDVEALLCSWGAIPAVNVPLFLSPDELPHDEWPSQKAVQIGQPRYPKRTIAALPFKSEVASCAPR